MRTVLEKLINIEINIGMSLEFELNIYIMYVLYNILYV